MDRWSIFKGIPAPETSQIVENKVKKIACIFLSTLVASTAIAEDKSYICVPDKSTGFKFNKPSKEWETTTFNVDDDKYLVRPTKDGDLGFLIKGTKYGVWVIGEDYAKAGCDEGFSDYLWLNCDLLGGEFTMNAKTKRFMFVFKGGYMGATLDTKSVGDDEWELVSKPDNGGDTPYIEIGKCSEI